MILFSYYTHLFFPKTAEKIYRRFIQSQLSSTKFSIISNNCWGGGIYEDLNIEYSSPTVGLFFHAPCYLKFLKNLNYYLENDTFVFIADSKYQETNKMREKRKWFYPIAQVGDIEIHFMHYKSETECLDKWNRRKKRIQWDSLYFKMCDRDNCDPSLRNEFLALPYPNKIFFGAAQFDHPDYIQLKQFETEQCIPSLYENPWLYRKYFNIVRWLRR